MCYIVINKTRQLTTKYEGKFPSFVEDFLEAGEDIIIISLYSDTVKIPKIKKYRFMLTPIDSSVLLHPLL